MIPVMKHREKSNKRSNTKSKKINEPKTKESMSDFVNRAIRVDDSKFSSELKRLIREEKDRQDEADKQERESNIKMIYGNAKEEEEERLERIKGMQERVAERLKLYNERKDKEEKEKNNPIAQFVNQLKNEELKKEELMKVINLPKEIKKQPKPKIIKEKNTEDVDEKLHKRRQEEKSKIAREESHKNPEYKKELQEELNKQYLKDLEQVKEHNLKKEKVKPELVKRIKANKINTEYRDDIDHLKYIRSRLTELRKLKRMKGGSNKDLVNEEIKHYTNMQEEFLKNTKRKRLYTKDDILNTNVAGLRTLISKYDIFKGGISTMLKKDLQDKILNSTWFKEHSEEEVKKEEKKVEPDKQVDEIYKEITTKSNEPPIEIKKIIEPSDKLLRRLQKHNAKIEDYKKFICQAKKYYNIKCNESKPKKESKEVTVTNDDLVKYIKESTTDIENKINDIKDPENTPLGENVVNNIIEPMLHELQEYPIENKEIIEKIEEFQENVPTAPEFIDFLDNIKEEIIINEPVLPKSELVTDEVIKLHPVELLKFEPNGKRLDLGHTIVNMYCGNHDPNQMIPAHVAHSAIEMQKLPSYEKLEHENRILNTVVKHNKPLVKKFPPVQTYTVKPQPIEKEQPDEILQELEDDEFKPQKTQAQINLEKDINDRKNELLKVREGLSKNKARNEATKRALEGLLIRKPNPV